jgi:hypothetical protein
VSFNACNASQSSKTCLEQILISYSTIPGHDEDPPERNKSGRGDIMIRMSPCSFRKIGSDIAMIAVCIVQLVFCHSPARAQKMRGNCSLLKPPVAFAARKNSGITSVGGIQGVHSQAFRLLVFLFEALRVKLHAPDGTTYRT